jgi:carboxyl-terminal processing protease
MVVLVNELTGGASEALAGSLQDAGRAIVLGKKSLGIGSENVFKELSDGSAIYIPVSYWYTPSGKPIKGVGIEPDIEVDLTEEDSAFGVDAQLTRAYDYLDDLLPSFR